MPIVSLKNPNYESKFTISDPFSEPIPRLIGRPIGKSALFWLNIRNRTVLSQSIFGRQEGRIRRMDDGLRLDRWIELRS